MSALRPEPCSATYGHLAHDWRSPVSWVRCKGVPIADATRAHPVAIRRHVLAELRAIKNTLALRIGRWAVTGTDEDDTPRRVDEFPENSAAAWDALARRCRDAIEDLKTLETLATQGHKAVIAFERRAARQLNGGNGG